jgi:hypothetical protein
MNKENIMTVETAMTTYLISNGMSDNQAESVIIESKESMSDTFNNWDSEMDAYSSVLQSLLVTTVKQVALGWLNANKPSAWFKPVFE